MAKNLGIIGCGRMAFALLKGLQESEHNFIKDIYISDISIDRINLFKVEFSAISLATSELIKQADIIILAIKPSQVEEILLQNSPFWSKEKIIISIAAGITLSKIEELLPPSTSVIRVMPNTPALIGKGISVLSPGKAAYPEQMDLVKKILGSVGEVIIMPEMYMDAVTAVSGSGPAYIYLVIEAMIDAAVKVGLNQDIARLLVLETCKGSIAMLETTGEHPAVLKAQVCSPAGTTIAGIRELEDNGLRKAFFDAIEAAWTRSQELSEA